MRLLNVIQRYPPAIGGSELWCRETSTFLAARGHDVRVATLDVYGEEEYWKDPLGEDRLVALGRFGFDRGVRVRRYHRSLPIHWIHHGIYKTLLDRLLNVYFYGPHSAEMYKNLRREIAAADVVLLHTCPYPHNVLALVVAKLLGKPTVSIPHFHPGHPSYERALNYWVLRWSDAVVTVTEAEASYLRAKGITAERLCVTGNGVHPEDYRPAELDRFREDWAARYGLSRDDRVVTFIGRKTPEKGVGSLVAAARDLVRDMPLKLFLVGPRFAWYDELYDSLGTAERNRIVDVGTLSHQAKVNLLHCSELLVLPSQFEAFGIVFLEAWMCGAPVVGTTEGAMPSVIDGCGYLSRFGDADDLKTKIREALSDRDAGRALADRGRRRVLERYTWKKIARTFEARLRQTAQQRCIGRRVVVCTNSYPPTSVGGAELIAHHQAKALAGRGYDVTVFAGEHDESRPRYSVRDDAHEGIPVRRVTLHAEDYSWEFFNFHHREVEDAFERFLDETSPEIVHFHNVTGLSLGVLGAAKRRHSKVFVTLHDYWGFCFKNTLLTRRGDVCGDFRRCDECLPYISAPPWKATPIRLRKDYVALELANVDLFLAPSEFLAEQYARAGIPRERIRHVPLGIDASRFASPRRRPRSRVRFVFAGYLGAHKGVDTLIEALPRLEGEAWELHLVGNGDRREQYEKRVDELGVADRVRFLGGIDNRRMARIYRRSDVLVLPSIWPENQPVSILEAMASGMPVIASDVGGIREIVRDGHTGLLAEPRNPAALARRMSELLIDRDKLGELGSNARRWISEQSVEREIAAIASIYEEDAGADSESRSPSKWTVACVGRSFDAECAIAIDALEQQGDGAFRFVMADWLNERELRDAKVLWVVDRDVAPGELALALDERLPLLVPAHDRVLRDLCVSARCGLYYADAPDALGCLRYLRDNEPVRAAMGRNALRALYSDAHLQVG